MKVKPCNPLGEEEPVSKAIDEILRNGFGAVIVKEDGTYAGWIDDRNIRMGIKNPKKVKVRSAMVKAPAVKEKELSDIERLLKLFLAGHFKGLPVVDEKGKVKGCITRADLLYKLLEQGLVPNISVNAIMSTPVYTVDENETLGKVKRLMKELGIHRVVVTSKGKVEGVLSTYDFLMFLEKPRERQSLQLVETVKRPDDLVIKHFIREPLVMVDELESLPSLVREMAEKEVSSAVVVKEGRPVGVVTAHDIFKLVLGLTSPKPRVHVVGLSGEDLYFYEDIVEAFTKVLEKFSKSFEFGPLLIRIKKGKSTYQASLSVEADNIPIRLREEDYTLEGVIAKLEKALDKQLRKMHDRAVKGKKERGRVEMVENVEYL